jgi:RND superfamily putative drug exporter
MAATFEGLARFVVRFRIAIVAVWAVVMVAAILALPGLGSESNSDPSLFLSSGARSVEAASLGTALLGSQDTSKITIVAARAGGPLTQPDLAAVAREARLAEQVSGVISARHLKGLAASGAGSISPDGRAVQFAVVVNHSSQDVAALRRVVNALVATLPRAGAPAGLQLHLAGPVATNAANNASANRATGKIGLFSIVFILLLLLIVLRSPVAALVTFVPSVVALLTAQRFIAGLGAHGLQISSVTQTLLVVLILGAGTDYGLFLVYRFREELQAGAEPHGAVAAALARVGESVTASAGTVILALLTLLLAGFGLYRDLAIPLAAGVAVMLLAGLTLLPALLALFAGLVFPALRPGRAERRAAGDGVWARVAAGAVRRPVLTLGVGAAIFAALALATFGYRTAGLNRTTTAPAGSDAAAGNAIIAAHFPQSTVNPAHLVLEYAMPVWQHPDALAQAAASLRGSGRFARLAGPLNANGGALSPQAYASARAELGSPKGLPLAEPAGLKMPRSVYDAYRATAQYVSPDGRTVQFLAGLRAGNQQSTAAMNATPAVRAAVMSAAQRSGATASGVAGQAAALYDVTQTADHDMVAIIPVAVLAIALLLGLVLRSLIAPIYLVASIAASYLAAIGLTTLLVIDLGGQDGLIFVLPFLMFVFLLALGEDYNILIMTRIREEAGHLPVREAVVRAIGRTGPTVTSAGLILAGTFGVFALAGGAVMGGQLRFIGLGLALGVLMDTFVVRTLLVPSAAVLLGRWNWWPSRLGRSTSPSSNIRMGEESTCSLRTCGASCAGACGRRSSSRSGSPSGSGW